MMPARMLLVATSTAMVSSALRQAALGTPAHELDIVGQIARNNRRMAVALYGIEPICYHTFDCRWISWESSATSRVSLEVFFEQQLARNEVK